MPENFPNVVNVYFSLLSSKSKYFFSSNFYWKWKSFYNLSVCHIVATRDVRENRTQVRKKRRIFKDRTRQRPHHYPGYTGRHAIYRCEGPIDKKGVIVAFRARTSKPLLNRAVRAAMGRGRGTRELNKVTIRNGRPRIHVIWMPQIGVAWIARGWSSR